MSWGLTAFFVIAAGLNIAAPGPLAADYLRWGYPGWFHYLTGALELASAGMLARRQTKTLGLALGACVMAAAAVTLVLHREWLHAVVPVLVLAALGYLFQQSKLIQRRVSP